MPSPHHPPISTVGAPTTAIAPQTQASVVLIAGLPPINTVVLPMGKGLTVGWWPTGGSEQACRSPATAAGNPPIKTVGTPGPVMIPPWLLTSVTLAAAGIAIRLIYLNDTSFDSCAS